MEQYSIVLSEKQQVRSQQLLEFWIQSVLRETAVWGIQSQLEQACNSNTGKKTLNLKSVGAVQEICWKAANIWASKVRLRGLTAVADAILAVASKGRDNLYYPLVGRRLNNSSTATYAPSNILHGEIGISSEIISDPTYRWALLYNLKRENANETLDRLLVGNPFHMSMVRRQSQRPSRQSIAVPTNASEEVIIRKRKSSHLKLRAVQEPRPAGRPRKPRRKENQTPRPPIDPEEALHHVVLSDAQKRDMDETMFHGKIEDFDTRLIASFRRDPRRLPSQLQAPVILESKEWIYILPRVKLHYNDDPTAPSTQSPVDSTNKQDV